MQRKRSTKRKSTKRKKNTNTAAAAAVAVAVAVRVPVPLVAEVAVVVVVVVAVAVVVVALASATMIVGAEIVTTTESASMIAKDETGAAAPETLTIPEEMILKGFRRRRHLGKKEKGATKKGSKKKIEAGMVTRKATAEQNVSAAVSGSVLGRLCVVSAMTATEKESWLNEFSTNDFLGGLFGSQN